MTTSHDPEDLDLRRPPSPRDNFDSLPPAVRNLIIRFPIATLLLSLPAWPVGTALGFFMGVGLLGTPMSAETPSGKRFKLAYQAMGVRYIWASLIWPILLYLYAQDAKSQGK